MSRIIYLSSARLPTEKAHGFQVMKMCEGIATLGHEVELFHPRRFQRDPALAETDPFAYYGVRPVFRLRTLSNLDLVHLMREGSGTPTRMLFAAHQLGWGLWALRNAGQMRPDLIFTRSDWFAYLAARLGRACAYEAHLPPTTRMAPLIRSFSNKKCARAVFALTGPTATQLRAAGVPEEKIEVLPDAVDLEAFDNAPPRATARDRLGLPSDRLIIGYVGRFETMGTQKGLAGLIRAVAHDEVRRHDPLLLCVGGPMNRVAEYTDLASSLGLPETAVRFVDRVSNPEVPTWLAALDVGLLPAPEQKAKYAAATSPMKLFEYMGASLPIVAADLPGVREILEHGVNGLMVPAADSAALASGLSTILADPAKARALGEQARRDAAEYTWERRAERALEFALEGESSLVAGPGSRR